MRKAFNNLFAISKDVIIVISPAGKILNYNNSVIELTGNKKSDLKSSNIFDYMPEEKRRYFQKLIQKLIKQRNSISFDYSYENPSGDVIPLEINLIITGTKIFNRLQIIIIGRRLAVDKDTEVKLRNALKAKEILLKEVHHRVKNNLQVIYSMLNLQNRAAKNPIAGKIIEESQNRIMTIAFIHDCLYRSDNLAKINIHDYVDQISCFLVQTYARQYFNIAVSLDIDKNLEMDISRATTCGIIINELLSNSLKHAFPEKKSGNIKCIISHLEDEYTLCVYDDGCGFDSSFTDDTRNFGIQLVYIMTEHLKGFINFETDNGTKVTIKFPIIKSTS